MAKLMHSLGLLATDRVVEVAALDLTGEFVGHSKKKVQEAMDAARGGVLFIDEAYALGGLDKFCKDARDTLVQLMTDERYKVQLGCCLRALLFVPAAHTNCSHCRHRLSLLLPDTKARCKT